MKALRPAGFLNVDLEVEASYGLDALAREMGTAIVVLHSGRERRGKFRLSVEASRWPSTPNAAVVALCCVVERLSPNGRRLWDKAKRKEFDIGYELQSGAWVLRCALKPKTLNHVVAMGATVAFTCYREDISGA